MENEKIEIGLTENQEKELLYLCFKDELVFSRMIKYFFKDQYLMKHIEVFALPQVREIFIAMMKVFEDTQHRPSAGSVEQYLVDNKIYPAKKAQKLISNLLEEKYVNREFLIKKLENFIKEQYTLFYTVQFQELLRSKGVNEANVFAQEWIDKINTVDFEEEGSYTTMEYFKGSIESREKRLPTGIKELDKYLGGGIPVEALTILVGGTSSGKTAFGLNLISRLYQTGKKIFIASFEGQKREALHKIISINTGVSYKRVGVAPERQFLSDTQAIDKFVDESNEKIFFRDYKIDYAIEELKADLKEFYKKNPFDVLYVDYGGLLTSNKKISDKRFEQSEVHKGILSFAQEYGVAAITPVQSNKDGVKKHELKRADDKYKLNFPGANDSAESMDIPRMADTVICLSANEDTRDGNCVEILIDKTRGANKGTILGFQGADFGSFRWITDQVYFPGKGGVAQVDSSREQFKLLNFESIPIEFNLPNLESFLEAEEVLKGNYLQKHMEAIDYYKNKIEEQKSNNEDTSTSESRLEKKKNLVDLIKKDLREYIYSISNGESQAVLDKVEDTLKRFFEGKDMEAEKAALVRVRNLYRFVLKEIDEINYD